MTYNYFLDNFVTFFMIQLVIGQTVFLLKYNNAHMCQLLDKYDYQRSEKPEKGKLKSGKLKLVMENREKCKNVWNFEISQFP